MSDAMPADSEQARGAMPARAGVGLKAEHANDVLAGGHDVGWFEVHAENYMVAGGPRLAMLEAVRRDYPLSLHGVALSLGGCERLEREHLKNLRLLVERFEPALVSEHLAWSSFAGVYYADLLPLPCSAEALTRLMANVDEAQQALGRRLLIENPSHYLALPGAEMTEPELLAELARRTGCGLLIDVNNIHVSAVNLGGDAEAYVDALPVAAIEEIHLAGFTPDAGGMRTESGAPLLIDTHGAAVAEPVWRLFERLIARTGPLPALVEWDTDVPAWPVLRAEALKAERRLRAPARAA
jgi:uncharacterized protein